MDQPKLERLLRLMMMLTSNSRYTIDDIAERLEMSPRTVYRYIDTFRDAGFLIKKNAAIFKLDKSSPYFKDITQLVHFTEEEACILKSAIESIDETNLLKQNLKKKLYSVYDYKMLADTVVKGKHGENVRALIDAIEQKKQIVLHNYSSAHSNSVRDRLVEPFEFTTNYIQIWCYDHETKRNKVFKVSRIASVEVLSQKWEHEDLHQKQFMDIFRTSGNKKYSVKIKMNVRAANLLFEEYPLAEISTTKSNDNEYLLETQVSGFEGVGRFVMGLLKDVEVLKPVAFKRFLKAKMQAPRWLN